MNHHRFFGFVLVLSTALPGCDEPTELQPSVSGQVTLYDELGNVLPQADGVQVDALSASSVRQYRTFTDASGAFEVELPEDDFVPLLFFRDGFGQMFRFDVTEGSEPIQVDLFATSSAAVTGAAAVAGPCGTVDCLGLALEVENFFGTGTTRRVLRVYLGTDPEVDAFDYQDTALLYVPNDQPGLVRSGSDASFELDGLHGLFGSFTTGATVHLVIHGATENSNTGYPNPQNGLEVFTDLSPVSARTSFIIP